MLTKHTRKRKALFTQRGIALVLVLGAIAIIAVATTEFTYNTSLDYAAAANARDEMRAHFLARSSTNIASLVVKVQKDIIDRYRRYVGDFQLADYLPMFMGAFGGGKEELQSLVSLLGATGEGEVKGLGLKNGKLDLQISTDDGKINVNCANTLNTQQQEQVGLLLAAMVRPTAYDTIFEKQDGDGQHTDREMFVRAIIDYVDRDEAAFGTNGQSEDYGYGSKKSNDYLAKNNYIDSVEELRLVRGMDDQRWALFGPAFTAYGGCKVNVAAANDINVFAAVIRSAAKNEDDPVVTDATKLFTLAAYVAQARAMGIMFDNLTAFADFVKDPTAALGGAGEEGDDSGNDPLAAAGLQVEGVELDNTKLAQVARSGSRRSYRVEATGKVGRVTKKIIAVWDTETQNQNVRDPAYARGAWVYWHEE